MEVLSVINDSGSKPLRAMTCGPPSDSTTDIAVVLAGALSVQSRATAAPGTQTDQPTAASGASRADDSLDTTYMIEKALGIAVMRPAAGLARPELAALARFWEQTGNVVPKGIRLADFRQITVIFPADPIPSGPVELQVLQWEKPVAKEYLDQQLIARKCTIKERHGKKMYMPLGGGRAPCMMGQVISSTV